MKIVTAVVNNPEFIEIQYYTLKKYFKGAEYEFIVFNDAKKFPDFSNGGDPTIRGQIEETCRKLGIECINIPNQQHQNDVRCSVLRCAEAMNFVLHYQKQNIDKYLFIDSDMFLISDFDISKYENYVCAVVFQQREPNLNYLWNGIHYFDFVKIQEAGELDMLSWSATPGCDVGGKMSEWFMKQLEGNVYPDIWQIRKSESNFVVNNIWFIRHLWSGTWDASELPQHMIDNKDFLEFLQNDPRNENGKFFAEIYDDVFFHYRAGGNWRFHLDGMGLHRHLTEKLKSLLISEYE
jgi:hypothetical protein